MSRLLNNFIFWIKLIIVERETKESIQWPPVCLGLIYQSKRSKSMRREVKDEHIRNQ